MGSLQKKLAKARDRVEVVEAAYEDLRFVSGMVFVFGVGDRGIA